MHLIRRANFENIHSPPNPMEIFHPYTIYMRKLYYSQKQQQQQGRSNNKEDSNIYFIVFQNYLK